MTYRRAVDAFLERPRRDFRACLNWQDEDIERALATLPTRPPIFPGLRRSQQICVAVGAHMRRFGFYNDMGTGKTLIAMALAAYYAEAEGAKRFLVLVPNRVNIRSWLDQVEKHAPELRVAPLPSSLAGKLETLEKSDALLFVDTYAGFSRLCAKQANGSKKLTNDPTMLSRMAYLLQGMILDESSAIGNHNSLQTGVVHAIAKLNPKLCVFLLSGTPFGRDPHLLWPQMKLLDDGYTLGETLGLFRSAFFRTSQNRWGGYEHEFLPKRTPLLHKHIAHRSVRFALDDADLPAVHPVIVNLDLAMDASQYYNAALAQLRGSKGDYQLCNNAFVRMRQISSGFVGIKDADSGAREYIDFRENPKLEWIESQITSMDGQIIIWHDFLHSGTLLKRALDRLEVPTVIINGQISSAEVTRAYDAFTKGTAQVLLLNSQAGAYGLNLQNARYGIYYESPVPVIIRKQSELRFIRPGSEHKTVVKIDLVMRDTVDAAILQFHGEGRDLFKAILDGEFTP